MKEFSEMTDEEFDAFILEVKKEKERCIRVSRKYL